MLDRLGVDTNVSPTCTTMVPTIASAAAAPTTDASDLLLTDIETELMEMDEDTFHDNFGALMFALGDDISRLPQIHSLTAKYCDCCNRKGHFSDECHIRGIDFLPPTMRKKVEQYNLLNGNKPKVPPKDRSRAPPGDAAPPSRPPASRPAKETVKPAIKSLQASTDKITELFGDEGWQFNLDNFTSSILQAPLTNGEGQGLTSPEESDSISARRVITGQNPGGMAPTPPPTISALSTSNGQGLTSPGDSDLDQIPGVIAPTPAPMINAISTSSASDESQQTAVEISDHNEFDLENLQVNC